MSDRTPDTPETPTAPEPDAIDQSRRKLTGAALGASAIFTLASRPVWANQCSISGMASGNLSAPKVTCEGCTPGYWKVCNHFDSWGPTGFKLTDTFNSVFGVTQYVDCKGTPYTLLDVLYLNGNSYSCGPNGNKDANPSGPPPGCTNGSCFPKLGGDPISTNLGFHAVAALLNSAYPNMNFGYTSGELIAFFKAHYLTDPAGLKNSLAMLNERHCPLN
ncbi:hypothetical protein [Thiobacillus sedimenti]|uniref:Uncharacterized protein n=1 Tax=Thiobacillus sedimenti TaxID=3110231 RepID=A0ABZ1CHU9_9PROT|nr:hypothetical protein [Thiobacillus sp. SCUT-2]WRS38970.1 hypothetical protein VA613_13310 [Thiobacillus sp. SCUT-2]